MIRSHWFKICIRTLLVLVALAASTLACNDKSKAEEAEKSASDKDPKEKSSAGKKGRSLDTVDAAGMKEGESYTLTLELDGIGEGPGLDGSTMGANAGFYDKADKNYFLQVEGEQLSAKVKGLKTGSAYKVTFVRKTAKGGESQKLLIGLLAAIE